jgi:hypothetical protein
MSSKSIYPLKKHPSAYLNLPHTMEDRTPYTYLIGWSDHDKWYYGVRYGKKCHPSDLFVTYFTSSKWVKRLIKEHGNPDIIQIRKVFDSKENSCIHEHKVLTRVGIIGNNRWINKTTNKAIDVSSCQSAIDRMWFSDGLTNLYLHKTDIIPDGFYRGRMKCGRTNEKHSKTKRVPYNNGIETIWCYLQDRPIDPSWIPGKIKGSGDIRKQQNRNLYNDGNVCKLLFDYEVPPGWSKGNLTDVSGRRNGMYGKKHKESTKELIAERKSANYIVSLVLKFSDLFDEDDFIELLNLCKEKNEKLDRIILRIRRKINISGKYLKDLIINIIRYKEEWISAGNPPFAYSGTAGYKNLFKE